MADAQREALLTAWVDRYSDSLLRMCFISLRDWALAEDALQETFFKAYKRMDTFRSEKNTVFHLKELWQFLQHSFEGGEKLFKQIKKAQNSPQYEQAVEEIFRQIPLREQALWE